MDAGLRASEGLDQRFEPGWCMSSADSGFGASCMAGARWYKAIGSAHK
jgi:hypothetical protein